MWRATAHGRCPSRVLEQPDRMSTTATSTAPRHPQPVLARGGGPSTSMTLRHGVLAAFVQVRRATRTGSSRSATTSGRRCTCPISALRRQHHARLAQRPGRSRSSSPPSSSDLSEQTTCCLAQRGHARTVHACTCWPAQLASERASHRYTVCTLLGARRRALATLGIVPRADALARCPSRCCSPLVASQACNPDHGSGGGRSSRCGATCTGPRCSGVRPRRLPGRRTHAARTSG